MSDSFISYEYVFAGTGSWMIMLMMIAETMPPAVPG